MDLYEKMRQAEADIKTLESQAAKEQGNTAPAPEASDGTTPALADTLTPPDLVGAGTQNVDLAGIPPQAPVSDAYDVNALLDENRRLAAQLATIQGKYSAEVPVRAQELRDARDANEQLRARIAQLETSLQQRSTPPPAIPALDFPEEFVENYPDIAAGVQRAIANALPQMVEQRVAQTERAVEDLTRRNFAAQVTAEFPDWQKLEAEPGFRQWLGQYDDFLGMTPMDAMAEAGRQRDAKRVAAFYKRYAAMQNIQPKEQKTNVSAEHLVKPNTAVVPPSNGTKTNFTTNQFEEIHRQVMRGQISPDWARVFGVAPGRINQDSANKIMKELDAAMISGRVA